MSRSRASSTIEIIEQIADDFLRRDLAHHQVDLVGDGERLEGRTISMQSRELVHFGSCSYMGLETHPALIEAAQVAVGRYGTQFSSSRAYLALALYEHLEAQLQAMFGKPVVVSSTTTLGHLAALPVLIQPDDAVVLDLQVHHSVQMAAQLLKASGVPLHIIQHNNMNQLERKIRTLQNTHRRVWYLADGVYSMFGDFAPMDDLIALMDRYDSFYTYIDDAHGMSWAGARGSGLVRSLAPHHDRMVLAVSLNKAFACAGGALVFPNESMAKRVRNCGGPMIFSGPIQPPMLGAALASAELHLAPDFHEKQAELRALIDHTNEGLASRGLPQYQRTDSPLFFVPMGLPRVVANLVHRVIDDGFYVNTATFPATPMRQGGLRFMVNRHLRAEDINDLLDCVAHHYPRALHEEGSDAAEVARVFKLDPFTVVTAHDATPDKAHTTDTPRDDATGAPDALSLEHARTIDAIDPAAWDALFARRGNISHAGMQLLEASFAEGDAPEERWSFHYAIIRDATGRIVLAAPFTVALMKDDALSDPAVSRQVEALRARDPYYLTSRAVVLGGLITRGDHLHLDREHPQWREAIDLLLRTMQEVREQEDANLIMLREFFVEEMEADPALRQHLLDQGYVEQSLGDALQVRALAWQDVTSHLTRLNSTYRRNVRKEILAHADQFTLITEQPQTPAEIEACYRLYRAVHARSFALNVFALPLHFFKAMCASPEYEVLRLVHNERPDEPVAVMFSFVRDGVYSALIVGLDDEHARRHPEQSAYKQILFHTLQRAGAQGCDLLDLAYTADLAKKKLGARPHASCAYVQAQSHLNQMIIETMSRNVR